MKIRYPPLKFINFHIVFKCFNLKVLKEINDQKFIDEIVGKINDRRTFPDSYYGFADSKDEFGTCT